MPKPNIPIHCGKPGKPYFKKYFEGKICHSIEFGYYCQSCGQIRLPSVEPLEQTYMNSLDKVREEAIEFWKGIDFDIAFPALIRKRISCLK